MKIAVDAMGGDHAPKAIVEGVMQARDEFEDVTFLLYGDEKAIREHLKDESRIQIVHTLEKITSEDEPVRAIRRKKEASMVLAAKAVKEKEADAMFSAGNTGALLAAGLFIVGRMPFIERPGLMATLPTFDEKALGFDFIDLGANADNKPEHLNDFATLASQYAKSVRQIEAPRVGLLNNGTEATKGNELTKAAFELLKENPHIHFIGNVEARDLLQGVADVVVADGYTGNAVLKSIEGTGVAFTNVLKSSIMESGLMGKLGAVLLKDTLKGLKTKMDYSTYGGAVLAGLKAPVVKTHGSTGPDAVFYTIRQIRKMLQSHVIDELMAASQTTSGE
ncbi:phosphate acyltransferase PlsX [Vagococcus lutrae]|uniref:phosphate acyltransferase PlsX n=1 Tax=Vagococcus lutrae TaxID=81947 RepID=UPI00201057CF|nr:phosphate acyltransferase PlsX [Vagococcus lutrae]UQF12423.1 phosphate acyltransferase PlsX [Vagococcus lutrae]